MKTPDGKEFDKKTGPGPVGAAARALGAALMTLGRSLGAALWMILKALAHAVMILLRAFGKLCITIWRLAAALDSALWRATKLLARRALRGLAYLARLGAAAFRSLVLWLPTRAGRAYSSVSGVALILMAFWIIDELRTGPPVEGDNGRLMRAPIDEEDPILARIEGRYIHLSEIEASARAGGFLQPDETLTPKTAFDRELVEAFVEQRLLARAALDDGLQRTPIVARRVNAARDRVLAAAFMERQIDDAVSPETVERLYNAQADVTRLGDEVRARHIVVETGEEAEEIIGLLDGGADFAALARERSIDRSSAVSGGDLGWFSRAMMTPSLANAAFSTRPGERAAPFQTEFGWHILETTDRRASSSVPFDRVKDGIADFLTMRAIETTLEELEEAAQVVYFRPEQ